MMMFNAIYINESLTQKNKALFKQCLKMKKDLHYRLIWTSNGKIRLRKNSESSIIYIKSKDDLQKLRR
jgi:hypothetical protein